MTNKNWAEAVSAMLVRLEKTSQDVTEGLPHWADSQTGHWRATPDGDWTGGSWIGQLWLANKLSEPEAPYEPHLWLARMLPRLHKQTAFKAFGFYYGAALGDILFGDKKAALLASEAAESIAELYDEKLGLIPIGTDAEEHSATGTAESSIDSLVASPLLFWSAYRNDNDHHQLVAVKHTERVFNNHVREDGSIIQSSTLDPQTGEVLKTHTHKGFNETSVWARAQSWAMLNTSLAANWQPDEKRWVDYARRTSDWWLDNVPEDLIAYWDFDDPEIPNTSRDTAATAMAANALLKLASVLDPEEGEKYLDAGRRTTAALVSKYLEMDEAARYPLGMLRGGCFTRRPDSRDQDRAPDDVELVFGSYMLLETLLTLEGVVDITRPHQLT